MSTKKTPPQAWFRNPTEDAALNRVRRIERQREAAKKQRNTEPLRIYIASPFKGDTETNVQNALRYCRFAVEQGYFPIAPHCYLPRFMDDDNPVERELALSFGLRLLRGCREVWVFGTHISEGMRAEIDDAKQRKIRIRYFTEYCKEVFPKC